MRNLSIVTLAVVSVFGLDYSCGASSQDTSISDQGLMDGAKDILTAIDKYSFHNVHFCFSIVETIRKKPTDAEVPSSWFSGEMWLSEQPNSLLKVNYSSAVGQWFGGRSPYFEEQKSIAYNGQYWLSSIQKEGPLHSMVRYRRAQITHDCPSDWKSPRWNTGEMFFLTSAPFLNGMTLKEALDAVIGTPIILSMEGLNITKTANSIHISIALPKNHPCEEADMWLDPTKGDALQRVVEKGNLCGDASAQWTQDDIVNEYTSVRGIWFPTKATRLFTSAERQVKIVFEAKNYDIIDDSTGLYDINLAPGTYLTDMRTNTSFYVGRDTKKKPESLKDSPK